MAESYRGLTIRIGADTTKLGTALKAATASLSATQAQARKLKQALAINPDNQGAMSLYLRNLGNQAVEASYKASRLQDAFKQAEKTFTRSDGTKTLSKLAEETVDANLEVERLKNNFNDITAELATIYTGITDKSRAAFSASDNDVQKFKDQLRDAGVKGKQLEKLLGGSMDGFKSKMAQLVADGKLSQGQLEALERTFEKIKNPGDVINVKNSSMEAITSALERLRDAGEISQAEMNETIADVERLKAAWQSASDAYEDMKDVAGLQDLQIELQKVEETAKRAIHEQNMMTKSTIGEGMRESAKAMAELANDSTQAQTRLHGLRDALNVNPMSLMTASEYSLSLVRSVSMAREEASGLKAQLSNYRASGIDVIYRQTKNVADNARKAAKEYENAAAKVASLEAELAGAEDEAQMLETRGKESAEGFERLHRPIDEIERDLREAKAEAEKFSKANDTAKAVVEYQNLRDRLIEVKKELAEMGTLNAVGQIGASAYLLAQQLGQYAEQGIREVVRASEDLDIAFTNLKKTSDASDADLEQFRESAVASSKVQPVSADQILNAEALGAQLGFLTDELWDFQKVANGLDIATNMDWETASTNMAQFFNIMGVGHDEVSNYGSAIVDLGNHMATTEEDISNMSMRIAGAGKSFNMTAPEVLGVSAALASMGVKAEQGGSAIAGIMNKVEMAIVDGGESLEAWAKVSGVTVDQFVDMWSNRPVEALELVFHRLQELGEDDSLSKLLDGLDISSIRQMDVARRLAANPTLLSDAVERANQAWVENVALQTEVDRRNDSLSGRLETMRNNLNALKTELGEGLVPWIEIATGALTKFSGALDGMSTEGKAKVVGVMGILAGVATLGPIISGVANNLAGLGSGIVKLFLSVASSVAPIVSLVSGVKSVGDAVALLQLGLESLPLTAIGIAALAAAFGVLAVKAVEANKKYQSFNDSIKGLGDTTELLNSRMTVGSRAVESFGGVAASQAMSIEQLTDEISNFNSKVADTITPVQESNALLGEYKSVIDELGGKGDIDDDNMMAKLEWAVSGLNEELGTNFSAHDILMGNYHDEEHEIENLTGYLDRLIRLRQIDAELKAAQQVYSDAKVEEERLRQNEMVAQERYQRIRSDYQKSHPNASSEQVGQYMASNPEAKQALEDMTAATRALEEHSLAVEVAEQRLVDFSKARDEAYKMRDMLTDSFSDQWFAWGKALEDAGINVDDFCVAAADAGVRVSDLENIMNDPNVYFADMVKDSNGSLQDLIETILEYNGTSIEEREPVKIDTTDAMKALDDLMGGGVSSFKDAFSFNAKAKIDVEAPDMTSVNTDLLATQGLLDGLAQVFGIDLEANTDDADSKVSDSKALVESLVGGYYMTRLYGDSSNLVNAANAGRGSVYSVPSSHVTYFTGSTSALEGAVSYAKSLISGYESRAANIISAKFQAAGGLRYHADGMILNRPAWIGGRDIAGEAGAEAIIPLTNRKYVQPFADTVAEGMLSKLGGLSGGTTYNLYLDGLRVNDDAAIRQDVLNLLSDLRRRANMNNG